VGGAAERDPAKGLREALVTVTDLGLLLSLVTPLAEARPSAGCDGRSYVGAPLRPAPPASAFADRGPSGGPVAADLGARLDDAFRQARSASGARAMTAAVWAPGRGEWSATVVAEGDPPDALFYWASAGKAFTAIGALQLVDEGRLSLADPVSRWVDGVPNGDRVTVEQLLDHTSGLYSANEDPRFRRRPHALGTPELVKILRRHGPLFCPGEGWRYTNSGYTLLGVILEAVDARPYDQVITERVVARLGDVRLRVLRPDDPLVDVAAPAPDDDLPPVDPRTPGPAGAIVGDARSMVTFWRLALGGALTRPETTRRQFEHLYPMFAQDRLSYGLGVMSYELVDPDGATDRWLGHSGGAPGVKAVVAYSLVRDAFVAVALTGDGSAEASANLLLRALD
jgi:D-alanyl-D-alanine carboxypeptidase